MHNSEKVHVLLVEGHSVPFLTISLQLKGLIWAENDLDFYFLRQTPGKHVVVFARHMVFLAEWPSPFVTWFSHMILPRAYKRTGGRHFLVLLRKSLILGFVSSWIHIALFWKHVKNVPTIARNFFCVCCWCNFSDCGKVWSEPLCQSLWKPVFW